MCILECSTLGVLYRYINCKLIYSLIENLEHLIIIVILYNKVFILEVDCAVIGLLKYKALLWITDRKTYNLNYTKMPMLCTSDLCNMPINYFCRTHTQNWYYTL